MAGSLTGRSTVPRLVAWIVAALAVAAIALVVLLIIGAFVS